MEIYFLCFEELYKGEEYVKILYYASSFLNLSRFGYVKGDE